MMRCCGQKLLESRGLASEAVGAGLLYPHVVERASICLISGGADSLQEESDMKDGNPSGRKLHICRPEPVASEVESDSEYSGVD